MKQTGACDYAFFATKRPTRCRATSILKVLDQDRFYQEKLSREQVVARITDILLNRDAESRANFYRQYTASLPQLREEWKILQGMSEFAVLHDEWLLLG